MKTTTAATIELAVWEALASVPDPEIPAVSVVDMGMIKLVEVDGDEVRVTVLPTFTGCPAIGIIKEDVNAAVAAVNDVESVKVETTFDPPWTTDRITEEGRAKLKEFGLAPPTGEGPVLIANIGLPITGRVPVLWQHGNPQREPLRSHAVPGPVLLRELSPALRAVQRRLVDER